MTRLIFQKKSELVENRETQRFLATDYHFDPLEHVGQRGGIHYLRSRVTDIFHHDPDAATALVTTLAASHVRRLADARQRRNRPVQHAYNVPDADEARVAAKEIPPTLALFALQQPLVLELQQDQFQELARDTLALRQIGNQHRSLSIFLRQNHHRLERVFRLLREHLISQILDRVARLKISANSVKSLAPYCFRSDLVETRRLRSGNSRRMLSLA